VSLESVDMTACSEFTRLRKISSTTIDFQFTTWTEGFISGWNSGTEKPVLRIDPAAMPMSDHKKFIEDFCVKNPTKCYLEAGFALRERLKSKKASRTGKTDE